MVYRWYINSSTNLQCSKMCQWTIARDCMPRCGRPPLGWSCFQLLTKDMNPNRPWGCAKSIQKSETTVYRMCGRRTSIYHPMVNHGAPLKQQRNNKLRYLEVLIEIYRTIINIPGWWFQMFQPLWKIWKSIGMTIPNIWKNNIHVPNHQPDPFTGVPWCTMVLDCSLQQKIHLGKL